MEKIKISVITNNKSIYNQIKHMLNKINVFDVDCIDNIQKCIDYYDIIMIDMDAFKSESEKGILQIIQKLSNHKKVILLKSLDNIRYIDNVDIVVKPVTEMKLIDSICNVILDDLTEVLA